MMGTLFVSTQDVYNRTQISSEIDGVEDVVKSALEGAHRHLESRMPAKFDVKVNDLWFKLDSSYFSGIQPGGRFKIEAPSHFIRLDQPLTLTWADTWGGAEGPVDPSLFSVEYEKGQISIDATGYADKFVHLVCTTGFLANAILVPADPLNNVEEQRGVEVIPDWLTEGIVSFVAVVLDVTQATNRSAQAESIYRRAGEHALAVMADNIRRKGMVIRALNL